MANVLTRVGAIGFSTAMPGPWGALVAASANLQTQLAALASFQATVDFGSLSAGVTLAGQIAANLNAAIALGLTPPSVSAQFALVASLVAALQAQLNVIMGLLNLGGTLQVYTYDGNVSAMGGEMTSALSGGFPGGGGPSQHCFAIIVAATDTLTETSIRAVFKTSP